MDMPPEQAPARRESDSNPPTGAESLQQLSHDIRSAMSDVLGGLRLVETGRLDPQAQTQIERVSAAADTLAALVDDALMIASGETAVRRGAADLDLTAWLATLNGRWAGRAAERGSTFKIRPLGTLPKRVVTSPLALERIVGNLIGNALIHAPGGDVTVEVLADHESGLTLCVTDTGKGFPQEVIDALSGRGETRSIGATGGSGLGLRIARALTGEMGAELTVTNDAITSGGAAAITLPPEQLDWRGEGARPSVPPDLSGLRILVAEDNLTNQTILRQMLEQMQAQTVFVTDGQAAVEILSREDFDIALIDIEMPRMNGLEVMQTVRARSGRLATLPLVAITAYVLRDNREAIYEAGADGIIGKPIASPEEFGHTILRHVGRQAVQLDTEDMADGAAAHAQFETKMDKERFERLLLAAGEDGRDELLLRLGEDLNSVRTLLDKGVAETSIKDIRSQTHILIALSGAVGADRLCQFAEALNIAAKRNRLEALPKIYAPVRADLDDLIKLVVARRADLA